MVKLVLTNWDPILFDSSRRWLYMNQWAYGGHTTMDLNQTQSIYTWYRESAIGNKRYSMGSL